VETPIDKYARYALLEDELIDELIGKRHASPTKSKGREKDVWVETDTCEL
jgi:hypothetical protein